MRYSGIIEVDGLPTRPKLKNAAPINPEDASANPTPDEHGREQTYGAKLESDRKFALASASLRQALQDMPELTEISKHIMIEETKKGLNIEIVDQNGRSMFPEGSKEPYERTRQADPAACRPAQGDAVPHLDHRSHVGEPAAVAGRLRPVGALRRPRQRGAQAARSRWRAELAIFFMVAGRADTQPLFPDDPYIAANRRVTITLMREEPPMPQDVRP